MLSFVLSKAGAVTAAGVLGLGGLGAYALASVPDSPPQVAAQRPEARTEVVRQTRHVQVPPQPGSASLPGAVPAAPSDPAAALASMPSTAEESESDDEGDYEHELGEAAGEAEEELGDD